MKNTAASCVRQSILNGRFLLGALFAAAAVFLASTQTLLEAFRAEEPLACGFHGAFVLNALGSDTITLCLPVVCALPYAASYVDDVKTGFIRLYIHRTRQGAYIAGKALGCVLSGGLVFALGILLACAAAAAVFLPMEAPPEVEAESLYFRELLAACGRFFLSGGFWALFGMAMSARMESKYIAYASPFIFYYVLIILRERYFDGLYVLYPKAWLSPGEEWVLGKWSVVPLLLGLTAAAALCFAWAVRRRVSEL